MIRSDSIANIGRALAAAQAELGGVVASDSTNPMYDNSYASLNAIIGSIRGVLNRHEMALVQAAVPGTVDAVVMETMLIHGPSGEFIGSHCEMPVDSRDSHGVASAQTYARRYGLLSLMGLAQGPDDDGNAAQRSRMNTAQLLPKGNVGEADPEARRPQRLASPETILAEIEHSDHERLNAAERWVNSVHLDAHLEARLKGAIAQRRRLLARSQAQHA